MIYQQYGVNPPNVTGSMWRSSWSPTTGEHSVQKPTVGPYQLGGWGPRSYPTDWLQNYWMQMNQQMTPNRVRPERGFTQGGMLGIGGGFGGRRWQAGGVTQNAFAVPNGGGRAPAFRGGFANAARPNAGGGAAAPWKGGGI